MLLYTGLNLVRYSTPALDEDFKAGMKWDVYLCESGQLHLLPVPGRVVHIHFQSKSLKLDLEDAEKWKVFWGIISKTAEIQ